MRLISGIFRAEAVRECFCRGLCALRDRNGAPSLAVRRRQSVLLNRLTTLLHWMPRFCAVELNSHEPGAFSDAYLTLNISRRTVSATSLSSSHATIWRPLSTACDGGVWPTLFFASALVPLSSSSRTTASCTFRAAHNSGVRPLESFASTSAPLSCSCRATASCRFAAAHNGHAGVVKLLLEKGTDGQSQATTDGRR